MPTVYFDKKGRRRDHISMPQPLNGETLIFSLLKNIFIHTTWNFVQRNRLILIKMIM